MGRATIINITKKYAYANLPQIKTPNERWFKGQNPKIPAN